MAAKTKGGVINAFLAALWTLRSFNTIELDEYEGGSFDTAFGGLVIL